MEKNKGAMGFNPEELSEFFDKINSFGSGGVSVTTKLPKGLRLGEVIGIRHFPEVGKTKATYRRGEWLYLCVLDTRDFSFQVTDLIAEIKSRKDWHERWEDWELVGDENPEKKLRRILKSRCKNAKELEEWGLFYG